MGRSVVLTIRQPLVPGFEWFGSKLPPPPSSLCLNRHVLRSLYLYFLTSTSHYRNPIHLLWSETQEVQSDLADVENALIARSEKYFFESQSHKNLIIQEVSIKYSP